MAQPMIWDDQYRMGIDQLDREHQTLFDHYNWLMESLANPTDDAAVTTAIVVAVLEEHATTHFEHEEALMVDSDYPHYIRHKMDHEAFMVELHRLKSQVSTGEAVLGELCRFLKTWLTSHIIIRDMAIVAHLRDRTRSAD